MLVDITLNETQVTELTKLQLEAMEAAKPESDQLKQQYTQKEFTKLVEQGVPEPDALKIINTRLNRFLLSSHVLFGRTCGRITVEEVMANPELYKDESFNDPLEEHSTNYRAKLILCAKSADDPTLVYKIRSFAHGGTFYKLEYFSPEDKEKLAQIDAFVTLLLEKYITDNRETDDEVDNKEDVEIKIESIYGYGIANGDDWADSAKASEYMIDGLLETDSHGILAGQSMSYKTFVALMLAYCICTGTPFMGHDVYVRGRVLIVCGEGKGGLKRRIRAITIKYGDFDDNLMVLERSIQIDNPAHMQELKNAIDYWEPILVIFDTFASLVANTDENSPSSVGPVLRLIKETCRNGYTSSMIVHHYGKDPGKGMRGASNFTNDVDFSFSLKRENKKMSTTMACEKMKDGEDFADISLAVAVVPLGLMQQNGKEATSLVIVQGSAIPVNNVGKAVKLRGRTSEVHKCFLECFITNGLPVTPEFAAGAIQQNCPVPDKIIEGGIWRQRYYDKYKEPKTDAEDQKKEISRLKRAFDRGYLNLLNLGLILVVGTFSAVRN